MSKKQSAESRRDAESARLEDFHQIQQLTEERDQLRAELQRMRRALRAILERKGKS